MMQTVQLSISDAVYAAVVREALAHTCAWRIEPVERADLSRQCVLVVDEAAFARMPLPLMNPERVVLITRKDPQLLAQAWEAGIVSVVSEEDSIDTVLLAIMSAALRSSKPHDAAGASAISPNRLSVTAPIPPQNRISGSKRCKLQ